MPKCPKKKEETLNILVGILKYPPDYAGDGLRLHRTFQRLMKKGSVQNVYVLTSWDRSAAKKNERQDGISIIRPVECTLKPVFKRLAKKLSLIRQIFGLIGIYFRLAPKIDIVLTSGSGWFPSLISWLAFLTRKPVVKEIVLLGSDDPLTIQQCKAFWMKWFFLMPFRLARLIVTISPPLEKTCREFGIPAEKIWNRFNPVDFEGVPEPSGRQAGHVPVILWIGTVTPRKNVLFLLRAAAHLKERVRVRFVGPCYDSEYMRQLDEVKSQLPPHVEAEFIGPVKNRRKLARLYSQASLFWFASVKEGMGNVVAESLFCGTPVVTLPVMGIMKQVIPSAEDGEIVDTDDPAEFAEAALKWLHKPVDRAAISKRARERFDVARVDEAYITHFEKILNVPKAKQAFVKQSILIPEGA